jgi:membrane protein
MRRCPYPAGHASCSRPDRPRGRRPDCAAGRRLFVRTIDDTFDDRVPGLAAEIAFFVLLSLPPLLLTLLASIGLVGDGSGPHGGRCRDAIRSATSCCASDDDRGVLDRLLDALLRSRLSVPASASCCRLLGVAGAAVVTTAITIAYDLESPAPAGSSACGDSGLTLGAILVGLVVMPSAASPGRRFGARSRTGWVGSPAWPRSGVRLLARRGRAARCSSRRSTTWPRHGGRRFTATCPGPSWPWLLWLAGTVALRVYVGQTIGDAIYQPIAGPIVVLLWLYVSGLAVLLGAELNAAIEAKWPTRRPRRLTRYR